jgi:hypothetical protein
MLPSIQAWPVDGRYLVSSEGYVIGPSGRRIGTRDSRTGYQLVGYRPRGGQRTTTTVHAMVCETFHGPRPPGQQARHINGNCEDCRAENLHWGPPRARTQ